MASISIWQVVLGIFLILLALTDFGMALPHLVLAIFALLAGIAVLAGK